LALSRVCVAGVVAAVTFGGACATTQEKNDNTPRIAADEPWRATRPAAAEPAPVVFPTFQKIDLKNGLTVILVEDHSLPTIHAAVVVRAGTAMDGRDIGVANLAWDLVDEGTGDLGAAALANAFGDVGATVSSRASREYGMLMVKVLKPDVDGALHLLGQMAQKPAFNGADFDRVKKLRLASLAGKDGDPETLAWQILLRDVYGADHPYGHPGDGTVASVEKLKVNAVKKYWSEHTGPKNAALVLVGDVTPDEAKAWAEKHLGKWKGGPSKAPKAPPTPKPKAKTRVVVIDFPGAPQTMIRMARPLMSAADPDHAAAIVMNQVLGGMFTSRLNLKLREEKQWTYGAGSGVDARLGVGPFYVATDIQTDKTGDALVEIFAQLDTLKTGGVTDEELALAKANYLRSLPGLFAVSPLKLNEAAQTFALQLPQNHQETLAAAVEAVTAEQVKAAAERAIVKDDLVVVLVGDRKAIEAGIEGKDLGDVAFVNRDGTPAK
jgi:predicted Zn-dependent peptidase